MSDLGVIDHFLDSFARSIDSGFGLVGGDVGWLAATLIGIDVTLAALFWAMGGADDLFGRLIKKILYVGAFAFLLNNWNNLAGIVFRSFAALGLRASGSGMTEGQLLHPGQLAAAGVNAGRPLLDQIGEMSGFPQIFETIDVVAVLFVAWLVIITAFFILAVQLFVTLIEFKLTTLAGFVLVPFAFWTKTAFLAERVLGNVVSSGIKVLVLAIIVGIGSGLFAEITPPAGSEVTIDQALAIVLGSLSLLGLGIFGPGIASGLVSGAPQLGAGAAAGTALAAGGLGAAAGALAAGGLRAGGQAVGSAVSSATSLGSGARAAYAEGGVGGVIRAGINAGAQQGRANMARAFGAAANDGGSETTQAPAWARAISNRGNAAHGAVMAAHTLKSGDGGGGGATPTVSKED